MRIAHYVRLQANLGSKKKSAIAAGDLEQETEASFDEADKEPNRL
jgi:hypothetical protein